MKEWYYNEIRALLDKAASDRKVSTEQYADLCDMVANDAQNRRELAERDLQNNEE